MIDQKIAIPTEANRMCQSNYFVVFMLLMFASFSGRSQTCYDVFHSYSGLGSSYNLPDLHNSACTLQDTIGSTDFKILLLDLYPILAYSIPTQGYLEAFNRAYAEADAAHDGFILISKEFNLEQEINYNVNIKYGEFSAFDGLSLMNKEVIDQQLNDLANDEIASLNYNPTTIADVDVKVLNKFLDLILNGVNEGFFDATGFEKIKLANFENFDRLDENTDSYQNNISVYNFDGHQSESQELGLSIVQQTSGSFPANITFSVFITGKEISDVESEFESVLAQYKADQAKIKIWLHFDFETALAPPSLNSGGERSGRFPDKFLQIRTENNLSASEAQNTLDGLFEEYWDKWTESDGLTMGIQNCTTADWQWGKKCIYFSANMLPLGMLSGLAPGGSPNAALIAGFIDGFLATIKFFYDSGDFLGSFLSNPDNLIDGGIILGSGGVALIPVLLSRAFGYENFFAALRDIGSDPKKALKRAWDKCDAFFSSIGQTITSIYSSFNFKQMIGYLWGQIKEYIGEDFNGSIVDAAAYNIGILAFEVVLDYITVGAALGLRGAKIAKGFFRILDDVAGGVNAQVKVASQFAAAAGKGTLKFFMCKILRLGCFVKDTPVLMANKSYKFTGNPFRNNTKALALSAAMPIVTVPIQDVQLLDYALAHKTVNSTYGITASADEDIKLGLLDKDLYTSDQQRERDEYEINHRDWNEVVFEEVLGGSTAKLALHKDWIKKQAYRDDAILNLNLPEMGISGLFKITSIKHILPQKKPSDDDEFDDYDYKPVTGLFIHEASDVWKIIFDNDEELVVTHNHPIYSSTKGDWEFAGDLEIGEEVLTKDGGVKVVSKEVDQAQQVYNLEVKDYHNYLVNASGIVVHNTGCFDDVKNLLKNFKITHARVGAKSSNPWYRNVSAKRNGNTIEVDYGDGVKKNIPINGKELPDFTSVTAKSSNGTPLAKKFGNLEGNKNRKFDNKTANDWLYDESGLLDDFDEIYLPGNTREASWIRLKKNGKWTDYTWHHHENAKTMMLVERKAHSSITHTGGAVLIEKGVNAMEDFSKLFPDPIF